jgi:hypothetical protein
VILGRVWSAIPRDLLARLALLVQLIDLGSFYVMVTDYGLYTESNPLVHAIGPFNAILAKVALILFLVWGADRFGRYRTLVLSIAFVTGAIGALKNSTIALF